MCRPTASRRACGPSKSGKPWDRFSAPVCAASWDIWVKIVMPTFGNLLVIMKGPCSAPGSGAARESSRIAQSPGMKKGATQGTLLMLKTHALWEPELW
ncbi:hypothetical protein D3C78_1566980 [compost metagenome]